MRAQQRPTLLLILILILGVVSACGTQTTEKPAPTEPEPTTRVVSTVNGEVTIPTEPKRIVALYYHHILLAFNIKPVGANLTWWGGSPFLTALEADGIVDVGGPPSLEAIAKLDPDLIIMNNNNAEDYDQLSKIAPSVLIPYDANRSSYEDAKLIGDLIGKQQEAKDLESRFEEKAAAARAKIAGKIDENAKVAIIRVEGKGSQFSVFGDNYGRAGWSIYRGLQLKVPDKIQKDLIAANTQIVQQLSLELLPEYVADADYILVSNEGEGVDLLKNSEVWKSLPAVKNNKVIELDGKQYFFFDPISIEGQLDRVTDLLLSLQ